MLRQTPIQSFCLGPHKSHGKSNQAISTHTTGTDCLRLEFPGFQNKALVPASVPWREEKQMKPQRHARFNLIPARNQLWYENKNLKPKSLL